MKKKLLMLLCIVSSISFLAACGGSSASDSKDSSSADNSSTLDSSIEDSSSEEDSSTPEHVHNYAEVKYDATNHWNECACGAKDETSVTAHSGGTATCTEQAICETCEQAYGDLEKHIYTEVKYDEINHWYECVCGAKDETSVTAHGGGTATCTEQAICETCEQAYGDLEKHTYTEIKYEATNHWYECACGAKDETSVTTHSGEMKSEENGHWTECGCGYVSEKVDHTVSSWTENEAKTEKTGACECGAVVGKINTVLTNRQDLVLSGETATIDLSGIGANVTVSKIVFNDADLAISGNEIVDGKYTLSLTSIDPTAQWGGKNLGVYVKTEDGAEHYVTVPVLMITKVINSLEELATIQPKVNTDKIFGYYVLGGDIDGNGAALSESVQIWDQEFGFRAIFDGRGHTISNFNTGNYGIFGNLAYGSEVKDLNLEVNTAYSNVLACTVRSSKLTNVTISVQAIAYQGWFAPADEINNSTVSGLTITYSENVLVTGDSRVLCKKYNESTFASVSVTTSIQNAEMITSVGTPEGVTVTTMGKLPVTVDTELYVEESSVAAQVFENESFKAGEEVTVVVNGVEIKATADAGSLTVDLTSANLTIGETYAVTFETPNSLLQYTKVMYVTKTIKSVADLAAVKYTGTNISGYFVVANDITATTWVNGAINPEAEISGGAIAWNQNSGFQGTFDGRGHTISGLAIKGRGIFGSLGKATIKNVNFTGIQLGWGDEEGYVFARNIYNTLIENVNVDVAGVYAGRVGATWVGVMCYQMNVYVRLKNFSINLNGQSLKWAIAYDASTNALANIYENVVVYNSGCTEIIGDQGNATQSDPLPAGITVSTK